MVWCLGTTYWRDRDAFPVLGSGIGNEFLDFLTAPLKKVYMYFDCIMPDGFPAAVLAYQKSRILHCTHTHSPLLRMPGDLGALGLTPVESNTNKQQ